MPPPPDFDPATARREPGLATPAAACDDEDLALGWECATPALQIEGWGERDSTGATEFH